MADKCLRCNSTKVIPDLPLLDRIGDGAFATRPSQVEVAGSPNAWFLKDKVHGELLARVCGDCGFTELYTNNHRELYEKYRKALEAGAGPSHVDA